MFGIKNHNLPVGRTLAYWTKILAIYIFKLPLLLTGIATMVNFCWPIGGFLFSQHKGMSDSDARYNRDCFHICCAASLPFRYSPVGITAVGPNHRRLTW
jgi:hypothetical protein